MGKRTGDEYESFEYLLVEKSREQKVGKKRAGAIIGKGALTDEGYDKLKGNFTHNNNDSDDDEISAKVKAALGDDDSGEGSRSGKSGGAKQLRSFLPTKIKKKLRVHGEDEEIGAAWSLAEKSIGQSQTVITDCLSQYQMSKNKKSAVAVGSQKDLQAYVKEADQSRRTFQRVPV